MAGEPDPEFERLVGVLAPLAYRGAAPRLRRGRPRRAFIVAAALTAAAAALVAVVIAHPWRPRPASWAATVSDGAATRQTRLAVGEWLDTGGARVRLVAADIGTVELAAGTRARIVATGPARHEMQLARGTLTARIDAPPRRFVVTTPRAVVTDLGCAFELTVDESGRGRLVVTAGRVAVASGDAREVVVPAGSRVELSERGPGAPYVPSARPVAPTTPAAPTPPAVPATPAPRQHAAVHATKTPSHAHASKKTATPPATRSQPHTAPAKKSEPARIEHDPLKALEHSVE